MDAGEGNQISFCGIGKYTSTIPRKVHSQGVGISYEEKLFIGTFLLLLLFFLEIPHFVQGREGGLAWP